MDVTKTNRDLSTLKKPAESACRVLFYECHKRGLNVFVTETYRSQERQAYLYAQGRTRPGQIVTWTLNSYHASGLAFDLAVCPPKSLYDTATLTAVGKVAKELGIAWGGDWSGNIDRPHFEVKSTWKLPSKYDPKVIQGVVVPSTSSGKVVFTVQDKDAYAEAIKPNLVKDAKKFRLMSGPITYWGGADKLLKQLLSDKILAYGEIVGNDTIKFRIQSGAYTTYEQAEIVAKKLIDLKLMSFISINGTLK